MNGPYSNGRIASYMRRLLHYMDGFGRAIVVGLFDNLRVIKSIVNWKIISFIFLAGKCTFVNAVFSQ